MAKTEGDPVLDANEDEIALSDSELDSVLKSADITDEAGEGAEDNLDQYGVWVKVEPQDVGVEAEQNMAFELADLENNESTLTEEEEQLLGELEEDEEAELGDLSGLEDDLEELGKGSAFEEESGEEELSVEDLDVDLDELSGDTLAIPEGTADLEGLPEMEAEEELSLGMDSDAEIEVPLSDSAIVEEHYEDLATVEGVPSTPGQAPPKDSADILEKIERDLNQIKAEIQSLKNELSGLSRGGVSAGKVDIAPAPTAGDGFFEKGEEETIALTGDELDNILNTADITEEVPEEGLESLDEVEFPDQDLAAEFAEEAEGFEEEEGDIMELGSLDLEEEAPSEEISLDDSELSLEEMEPSAAEEESIEIDIGGKAPEEDLSLDEDLGALEGETEELEELGLEEAGEDLGLEELDSLDLEEPEEAAEELALEEPIEELSLEEPGGEDLEELSLEEPGEEEVEELGLEEPGAEEVDTELSLEEPAEEMDLEELDTLSLEESGVGEAEAVEELTLEEPAEELALEEPGDSLSLEETGAEDLEELGMEDAGIEEAAETEEYQLPGSPQTETGVLPDDLKSEIKSVLSYFDQLLEALPEDKIREFAQSEYFVRYKRLFEELGLGA
ncbi:MAG: hypothetical protein JSV89_04435 [Spirochaetaceae bacterium]|nr:MAG: hypothetical protein JSV89_04435 [Spirochaetaceae bacterium]